MPSVLRLLGPQGRVSLLRAAIQALHSAVTHSCGQEEVERQELKSGDPVTAADAMELDALVVVNVKPAVLGDGEQCLRVQKPERGGAAEQREREPPAGCRSISDGLSHPPRPLTKATDRTSRTASMTLISHMSFFVTQSRAAT